MTKIKLIVQPSRNCIKLLKYFNQRINDINKLSYVLTIEKLGKNEFDCATVEMLKKRGITRLPSVILPNKKIVTGFESIVDMFERKLSVERVASGPGGEMAPGAPAGPISGGSLDDFWMKEMFETQGGKLVFRADADSAEEDAREEMQRKMRERAAAQPAARAAPRQKAAAPITLTLDEDFGADEGFPDDRPRNQPQRPAAQPPGRGAGSDAQDDFILQALLDKNDYV
jgi:hypothetical protein